MPTYITKDRLPILERLQDDSGKAAVFTMLTVTGRHSKHLVCPPAGKTRLIGYRMEKEQHSMCLSEEEEQASEEAPRRAGAER